MLKKIRIYLESSALWNLYYNEIGAELVEKCLTDEHLECTSSIWSQLEIARGINKRKNQKEITAKEAENLLIFIETDIQRMINKKLITFFTIKEEQINLAKQLIREYNLYSSDALHVATAIEENCRGVVVDDYHFKRLDENLKKDKELIIIPATRTFTKMKEQINY